MDSDPLKPRLLLRDESALAELFELHHLRLVRQVQFRLDTRLTGRVDPDDVVQEAYLDARVRLPHFDGGMSSFLWVRWVVQQTLIAVHRRHLSTQMRSANRERSLPAQNTSFSLAAQLVGHPTSPSEVVMREERAMILTRLLEDMSELDREVIALRHFEDLSNAEVAESLGISGKAASIRYVRALSRLKGLLSAAGAAPTQLAPRSPSSSSSESVAT